MYLDADMRMVADENLNRAIRSLGESNITRIHVICFLNVDEKVVLLFYLKTIWKKDFEYFLFL